MSRRVGRSRRAYVLLVVVGALALLAVLVAGLSSQLRLEQAAAANALEEARARLVADAGVERAVFLLTEHELAQPLPSLHVPWAFRSQDGARWGVGVALADARNPSFKAGVSPHGVAYSGWLSTTHGGGEMFTLRVVDLGSRMCLNGQQASLASMLDVLGRAIAEDTGGPDPVRGRGAAIVDRRLAVGGTFTSLEQLHPVLSPEDLEVLRPYVTLDAWRDPVRGLCPVNVNTASWPVLVACLEGVSGREHGRLYRVDGATARWLATELDARRADPALGPLTGPQDLETFLDVPAIEERLEEAEADDPMGDWDPLVLDDVLLANADPFVVDASRNPDATHLARGLDQRSMRSTTVPFCYLTYGLFEVESLGRVVDGDGKEIARAEVRATLQVYDVHRLSTQEDFEVARAEDDPWQVESYPTPVAAFAGPRRYTPPGPGAPGPTPVYSIADPEQRRRLRWRVASEASGYLQAAPAGLPGSGVAFRFDGDLQSERGDAPLGERFGGIYTDGYALGVHPWDLGRPDAAPNPAPEDRDPADDALNPDGLSIYPGAGEVRYSNAGTPDDPTPILGSSAVIEVRFKLGAWGPQGWTPLLEGRLEPDARYAGLGPADYVDVQVEGQLVGSRNELRLRTRFASTRAPNVGGVPGLPPEIGPELRVVEQHLRFGDVRPGEWCVLTLPRHLNAHVPLVNGKRGALDPRAEPWPAPAWPASARGTIAPGGFDVDRPPFTRGTIDDLLITSFDAGDDGGLRAIQSALTGGDGGARRQRRFEKYSDDLMGSFRGELAPFPADVQLGACTWAEFLPGEPDKYMVQVSLAHGSGAVRRQVSPSQRPPPPADRLESPVVRYWWLRHLRERSATITTTLAHTEALIQLAGEDAASRATFERHAANMRAAVAELEADIARVAARGPAPEPPSASVVIGREDQSVRFQLDLLHLSGRSPEEEDDELDHSPAVGEVLLLYQTAPRTLRYELP